MSVYPEGREEREQYATAALPELVRQVIESPYCTDATCWAGDRGDSFEHKHTEGHGVVSMAFVAGVGFAVEQIGRAFRGDSQ